MVIEYDGKSYSMPVSDTASLVTYSATGELQPAESAVGAIVDAFAKKYERPARNATFRWNNAKSAPAVTAGSQTGIQVDKVETANRLSQALLRQLPDVFPAAFTEVQPTYSESKPPAIGNDVLGRVNHSYNRAEAPGQNQEIGVRYLDGTIVLPGEVFNNDSQVYRQGQNVYKDSVVNVGDHNALAPGGGLCSLATIGFQAAFMAGMEIVERHPHLYWIVSYGLSFHSRAYRGLDATTGNMRWRNTTGSPVRVHAWADGRQSHVQIVGTNPGWQVTVASYSDKNFVPAPAGTETIYDKTRPVGFSEVLRDAHDGRDVSVTRVVAKDGTVIRRDSFVSHYSAVGRQLLLGAKK